MKTTATCKHCGRMDSVENMQKVESKAHNYFYVCCNCEDKMYGYSDENTVFVRQQKIENITHSIELETNRRDANSNILYEMGFMPTEDGTVVCEWKSPIYQNIRGLAKMFRTLESKLYIGHSAGTHLNIGTYTHEEMQYIRRFYHSLFIPLCIHMQHNNEKTRLLHGRYFTAYAETIDRYSNAESHCNFINTQHEHHLEFRLCKFVSANQYMNVLKFYTDCTKAIKHNFIENFNKSGLTDSQLKEYRLHKASITANKMIKLFDKYTENL